MSELLDRIREVDRSGQLGDVLALPEHLRDALFRVESARLEQSPSSGLLVCGMGGSAIGADLARAALGNRASLPLGTVRGYEIPPWTAHDRVIACSSYSGNTEEALACFAAAEALGSRRVVVTSGGELGRLAREAGVPVIPLPGVLAPRSAVGYMFVAVAELAALVGVAPAIRTEIDSAAANLEQRSGALAERAGELAERIGERVPVIYGSELTAPVAYRWKTQINENAKAHAFTHVLPELDHNEIVGWDAGSGGERFAAIFLSDADQHPRQRTRAELTAELIEPSAGATITIETEGTTRTERLLATVMLGDLLSLALAARKGIDPTPVELVERLKSQLAQRG